MAFMAAPDNALRELAALLRTEQAVIAPHVVDSEETPALGMLAAAGPRAAADPADYAYLLEAIREGYLLHYEAPRIVLCPDEDLALLAGDYLYALGLERLAALGDLPAVQELADLISLSAQIHAEERGSNAGALWLSIATAVAAGGEPPHERAKAALRLGRPEAGAVLWQAAVRTATAAGIEQRLRQAAEAIGFQPH